MTTEAIAVVAVLAIVPGLIATAKGRSFILWWLFGLLILPVAFVASVLISRSHRYECPFCREGIDRRATICPHCRSDLSREPATG